MNDYVGNRVNSRIPCKLKIAIKGKKFKETIFYTSDIASGGVFVPADSSPPLDLKLDVKLYLPHSKKPLKFHGKILRIKWAGNFERVEGFAIEFLKVDRETEDKYINFINKFSKEEF